ncbi:cytochrome P450 [Trametes meyenii]|nr:cytochrome P450 [Trametes meyenii]
MLPHIPVSIPEVLGLLSVALCLAVYQILRVPSHLRHIPKVPIWALLGSYFSGEVEDQRIKRIVLPFARQQGTGVVLVFCLGDWMVQVVDPMLGKELLENPAVKKQRQPDDMLLWRLIGHNNIFMSDGEMWKRHSRVFRDALRQAIPLERFISLSRTTFSIIGKGGRVRWSDLTHRYTLDAVATTVIGYDFEALDKPNGSFVQKYHDVMNAISHPAYAVFPSLERWLPRWEVREMVDNFVQDFCKVLEEKRASPGNDLITYMFQDPEMTEADYRDNSIVTFIGGHDTTAGALTTAVYLLARHPDVQEKVRAEVRDVLGSEEPRLEHFTRTPYLDAVLRESLRFNTPTAITVPRISESAIYVGGTLIPPNTPVALHLGASHHNDAVWPNPGAFDPQRFLDGKYNPVNWVSFGAGPRRCPARNFSLYEQRVLVSMLLREYRWSLPEDSVHRDTLKNGFSAFALSLPENVDIDFVRTTT